MAALLGPEIFSRGFRFNPTPPRPATYYLPGLVAGAPLQEAVRPVIHQTDVYACEPADLARQFRPMPRTGHRFFFTSCKKGVRSACPGFWSLQRMTVIQDGTGAKVGEIKKLRYKKRGVFTDWLMDEFSTCCSEDAVVGDRQAAPHSAARQESAAFIEPPAPAPVVIAQAAPPKRPAPQAAEQPCPKRTRGAVIAPTPPVVQPAAGCAASFAPPRPRVPNRGVAPPSTPSVTGSSPASAQPPAPAPTRLATPVPAPPRPLGQPKQQMPPPTLTVVRACHMPVQEVPAHYYRPQPSAQTKKMTRDPFEAAELRDKAEEERVVAASDLPSEESPAADQDDDWDELVESTEDIVPTAEAEEEAAANSEGSTMAEDAPDPASKESLDTICKVDQFACLMEAIG
ncbi:LOW QUALITY PROTEIN: hypothetical protein GQ55_8G022400 [Panicum hallii var. hallii]|uniref:NAC domain-containing protein n=1 Tax=Panicum hallii var. hallii TaxID=1504633 RepID=A0A2T7CJV0_9POAL|nr:LOW QUALITY PROTEIN: hypothetical protein GQ55_8G022400 [Panicum hallii var. hallii]